MALRVILGAMKTTPVHDSGKNSQCRATWEEKKSQNPHPGRKTEKAAFPPTTHKPGTAHQTRLEHQSLNHQYKELSRKHQDVANAPVKLLTDRAWRPDREAKVQYVSECPWHHLKGTAPWRAQKPHPCPSSASLWSLAVAAIFGKWALVRDGVPMETRGCDLQTECTCFTFVSN